MTESQTFTGSCPEAEQSPTLRWKPGAILGVIGGLGEMGRLFARYFETQGYSTIISDIGSALTNRELMDRSDIVLFAAPLHKTVEVMRELTPHARPDQLLVDVTSLKVGPVREMLRSRASVLGLHPMFGGRISSFAGQTLVACPVRIDPPEWDNLRSVFVRSGMKVKETTPEEHDRMMSIIQVLFHMTTMLTGRVLRELGIDIGETMDYTSPSYRLEINLIGRMFAQSPALYSAITQMNPYTTEIIDHLKSGLDSYGEWCAAENLAAFIGDFERSAAHLGKFCQGAYAESSALLDFVIRFANENGDILRGREAVAES